MIQVLDTRETEKIFYCTTRWMIWLLFHGVCLILKMVLRDGSLCALSLHSGCCHME